MALAADGRDIVETFTLMNLGNLTNHNPTLVIPAGLDNYYTTAILNNLKENIGLRIDVEELVKTLVAADEVAFITT